jgi:adenylate cyclase
LQFVGDEVFAVFGAPLPAPDDAAQAVRCALVLQRDVGRLDASLSSDGLPPIRFGIGLHRGEVVAAHVGTSDRRDFVTALGSICDRTVVL